MQFNQAKTLYEGFDNFLRENGANRSGLHQLSQDFEKILGELYQQRIVLGVLFLGIAINTPLYLEAFHDECAEIKNELQQLEDKLDRTIMAINRNGDVSEQTRKIWEGDINYFHDKWSSFFTRLIKECVNHKANYLQQFFKHTFVTAVYSNPIMSLKLK